MRQKLPPGEAVHLGLAWVILFLLIVSAALCVIFTGCDFDASSRRTTTVTQAPTNAVTAASSRFVVLTDPRGSLITDSNGAPIVVDMQTGEVVP